MYYCFKAGLLHASWKSLYIVKPVYMIVHFFCKKKFDHNIEILQIILLAWLCLLAVIVSLLFSKLFSHKIHLDWTVFTSVLADPMASDVIAPSPWTIVGCRNGDHYITIFLLSKDHFKLGFFYVGLRLFKEARDADSRGMVPIIWQTIIVYQVIEVLIDIPLFSVSGWPSSFNGSRCHWCILRSHFQESYVSWFIKIRVKTTPSCP